jgi:hypothetical protein
MKFLSLLLWLGMLAIALGFMVPDASKVGSTRLGTNKDVYHLFMSPRFDPNGERWYPSTDEEAQEAYGPVGSLIRQGPKPFLSRYTSADGYEQGVYKMMAQEGWSRLEAQGNMDAFIENPQDWMMQKAAEKKGAPKYDYGNANTDQKQIALTLTWAAFVFLLVGRVIYINVLTEGSGNIWSG